MVRVFLDANYDSDTIGKPTGLAADADGTEAENDVTA